MYPFELDPKRETIVKVAEGKPETKLPEFQIIFMAH